jgi:hypothetical protein
VTRDHDIARWRLRTQRLVGPHAADATEVVVHLLAVQAENQRQSEWAVASRTTNPSRAELDTLLDEGRLIRTHVLRPTWHYVHADDLGWLLDLTAPRVRKVTGKQLEVVNGLEEPDIERAAAVVVELLSAQPDRTRSEIAEALVEAGFDTKGQLAMILLGHLELDQLICSGRPRDGEHTYALFAERIPQPRRLDRDAALAELALRYFAGHGPATDRDLAYWATLTLGDVRRGLDAVRDQLASFEHDGRTFWYSGDGPGSEGAGEPAGHLLQILDELYRGYQDSRWMLDPDGVVPRGRETSAGMAVVDGRLVAGMRRIVNATQVVFELAPYRDLAGDEIEALERAAQRYGDFLGLPYRWSSSER